MDAPDRMPDKTITGEEFIDVNRPDKWVASKYSLFKVLEYTKMGGPSIDVIKYASHFWYEDGATIGIRHYQYDTCKWCRTGAYQWT